MLGFELVRADGTSVTVEATRYDVADDGWVVVFADDDVVFRAGPGSWVEIRAVGAKLTRTWPPESLDLLLDRLYEKLGVGYGHTTPGGLGPVAAYRSGLLNEIESLTAAVLERVGLDAGDSEDHREADEVRNIVGRHFHHQPRPPRHR